MSQFDQFRDAARRHGPRTAVVLGSGQSSVLGGLQKIAAVEFKDAPGLVAPSVAGHSGKIILGAIAGKPVLVFQGRLHFYEGHPFDKVGAPIRLAASLGIKTLLLTNAAGGIHPELDPGSMMIVHDHLFWQKPGSYRGPGPERCHCIGGARSSVYSPRLIELLRTIGRAHGEELVTGVYAAMTGPCYETPSEIRALQVAGADAVGMSTAHEAETGRSLGMECAAISAITNKGAGLVEGVLDHHDVLHIMSRIRERMGRLIADFIVQVG